VEFKRLTMEEAESVEVGTKLNEGNGKIYTVIGFTQDGFITTDKDHPEGYRRKLVICQDATGKEYTWYESVLTQMTTETLDKTVGSCRYCGKIRPAEEITSREIFVNHGRRELNFCKDSGCGMEYQMGCEG
jgi:hypothetical protein